MSGLQVCFLKKVWFLKEPNFHFQDFLDTIWISFLFMRINFKRLILLFRKWAKKKEGGARELFSGKRMSCACTYFRIGEAKRDDDYDIALCFL